MAVKSWEVSDEFWARVAPLIPKVKRDPKKSYQIPIRDRADVDRLEGYSRLYDRVLTDFCLPDGSTVQAWIYTMNHLPVQAKIIPSGDWKVR